MERRKKKKKMMDSLGKRMAYFRKKCNMTQLELANKIGITDKAISNWERDLSVPDIIIVTKLANIFGISVEELVGQNNMMKGREQINNKESISSMVKIILLGVGLAMGIAVTVLSKLKEIDTNSAIELLSLGVISIALSALIKSRK